MFRAYLTPALLLAACPAFAQGKPADERHEPRFDPAPYHQGERASGYRTLGATERVYRGADGVYYCRHPNGRPGLIAGAIDGWLLKDAIRPGHSRTARTLIAEVAVRVQGQAYDRLNHEIRCH